jgi:hypothetical protein
MISETLEPFADACMLILLWGFIAFLWIITPMLIGDNTWPYKLNVVICGLATAMLCALTIIVFLWTLTVILFYGLILTSY